MYQTRFGLRQRPFSATPDCAGYYPATGHERALQRLRLALDEQQGLALLTGEPGSGKTLLGQCLIEALGDGAVSAFVVNSHFRDRTALIQAVLFDLGLPHDKGTEQELRLRLTDFLLRNCQEGRRAVVVIDEAHHLSPDLLEELRLLGNLEAGASKAVHIVLIGQPSLLEVLAKPELASLCQRLEIRASLAPLAQDEAVDYLLHHLRRAGARPEQVIDEEALALIARGARGVPRLLNQVARQALVLADAAEADQVDVEVALEALAALGIAAPEEEEAETIALVAEDGAGRLFDANRRVTG